MKKQFKNFCCTTILLSIMAIFFIPTNVYASNINVLINGKPVNFTNYSGYPIVDQNNRTLVPLRVTMEATGALVGYDSTTSTAIVVTDHDRIEVPVGKSFFYNNNQKIENDTTAIIYDSRVYLPIRAVLESANYTVEWDSKTNTVNAHNFSYDSSKLIPYSTTDLSSLINNILSGKVIYINGNYYATPEYVNSMSNIKVTYADDINKSIYPQQVHGGPINIDWDDIWITTYNFYKGIAYDYELDDTSNLEPVDGSTDKFYVYGFYSSGLTGEDLVFPLTEFDENFLNYDNATATFNGIRVKMENGELLFNQKDLEDHDIPKY